MIPIRRWRAATLVLFTLLATSESGSARQQERPDDSIEQLSGAWIRNTELSDDVTKAMAGARSGGRGGPPGGMGGGPPAGMGGGPPGGMGGRGARPDGPEGDPAQMALAMTAPDRVMITVAPGTVTFVDADGMSQTFATTNRKEKHYFGDGMVETRTKWDDGQLIREFSFADKLKRTEKYALLAGETRRLQLTIAISGARLPREIRFQSTYDDARAR